MTKYGSYNAYYVCNKCDAIHHSHFGKRNCCRDCGNLEFKKVVGRYVEDKSALGFKTNRRFEIKEEIKDVARRHC